MIQSMPIQSFNRIHLLSILSIPMLATIMLAGCKSAQIIKPVPRSLNGRMTFISVRVKKIINIKSTTVRDQVKTAITRAVAKKPKSDLAMRLEITVRKWKNKKAKGAPNIKTGYAGIQIEIEGLVKVIDAVNGNVVAEFVVVADYQQEGRIRRPYSTNDPETRCLKIFANDVMRELY
jgi:hypothetical protein